MFLLMTLLGLGAAAALFSSFGSSDSDTDTAEDQGRDIELEPGAPNPSGTSGKDTFSGIAEGTVRGGPGDDEFSFENGYGAIISGGAGDDSFTGGMGDNFTLHGDAGNDLFAFDTDVFDGAVAYGGTGNDRFELDIDDSDKEAGPTLSGGSGEDTYDLTFSPGDGEREGGGKLVTITDFTPSEDSLTVTFPELTAPELVEDPDGNFTDLRLNYLAEGSDGPIERYMTIRLEGVTGATLEDFGFDAPSDDNSGNDTITGVADGSFSTDGGAGDDIFDIETGADVTIDGGPGNDVMMIGEGVNFTILGGAGNDRLEVASTSNIQESSVIDGGDGDDTLTLSVALFGPDRTDLVKGGTGSDAFTLNLAPIFFVSANAGGGIIDIGDFAMNEDDLTINIGPQDAPFYKGATLAEQPDGSTDLVLTFERMNEQGVQQQWTGVVKLSGTTGLVLSDDGPIQIRTPA